jgi:hypothetical protein
MLTIFQQIKNQNLYLKKELPITRALTIDIVIKLFVFCKQERLSVD